jgi:hypothetical protein
VLVSRARALAADYPLATTLLAALVLVRVTLPLAALAVSGSRLPGLPAYEYEARPGDAYGYYSAMRELMATVPRLGPAAPGVLLAVACLVVVFVRWRSRPQQRPLLALLAGASVAAIATLLVLRMSYAGAPTIGWPLVWSVPMLPYRMLGLPLDPDVAFGFGLALSLAANGVTVVSTYLLGLWTSGSRSTGLVAASLFGLWPFLLPVVGKTADLGTWQGDLGLSLYSEPLSTALVTTGAALLVRPGRGHVAEVVAGCLLGFSIAVRLSNLVIAVPLVALLALQAGLRSALRFGAAVAIFVPIAVAYWPLGYVQLPDEQFPDDPFALRYAVPAWRDSVVWGWEAFVALVPVAAVGFLALARPQAVLLASWILATAGLYTFYTFTPLHPRFLLVALPPLFVLWGAGASAVVQWAGAAFGRGSSSAASAR